MKDSLKMDIDKGEIFPFKSKDLYYVYIRSSNSIFEIDSKLGGNVVEGLKNDIDHYYVKSLREQIVVKKKQSSLIINSLAGFNFDEKFVIKDILEGYNNFSFTFLRLEINAESIKSLHKYATWFDSYERLRIICLVDKTNLKSIDLLYKAINEIKIYSKIQISVEYFAEISTNTNEPITKGENIKFSKDYLKSVNSKETLRSFVNQIALSKQFVSILKVLEKDRPINDFVIKTYPEVSNLENSSNQSNNIVCNKCWAKRLCYSKSLYSFFSSHPFNCSQKVANCNLIRNIILGKFVFYQENINLDLLNKFKTKKISNSKFKIVHINP